MANKNVYQLYIQIGDGSGGNGTIAGEDAQSAAEKQKAGTKGITLLTAYGAVQPFISGTQQIIMNDVQTNYSNTELTNRISIAMDLANFGVKTAVSVASGVSLASALGLSSSFGAGVGAIIAVGSKVMDIAVKQSEINNKARIENEQINILRGRAGVQFNKSRIGE